MRGLLWINDWLDDVRSDMSVFHRIDDIEVMEAKRFVAFAERLPAYSGAVLARLVREREEQDVTTQPSAPAPSRGLPNLGNDVVEVPATRAGMFGSPIADIVSWGGA
jgi:hypothetical protein